MSPYKQQQRDWLDAVYTTVILIVMGMALLSMIR